MRKEGAKGMIQIPNVNLKRGLLEAATPPLTLSKEGGRSPPTAKKTDWVVLLTNQVSA